MLENLLFFVHQPLTLVGRESERRYSSHQVQVIKDLALSTHQVWQYLVMSILIDSKIHGLLWKYHTNCTGLRLALNIVPLSKGSKRAIFSFIAWLPSIIVPQQDLAIGYNVGSYLKIVISKQRTIIYSLSGKSLSPTLVEGFGYGIWR